jgi:hypothetical protein
MTVQENEEIAINSKPPIFSVGNKVSSKTTGYPGVGIVIASMPAIMFMNFSNRFVYEAWNIFQNYQMEYVYIVAYQEPRRNVTFDEWASQVPQETLDLYKDVQKVYEISTSPRLTIVYPEQDLELFE